MSHVSESSATLASVFREKVRRHRSQSFRNLTNFYRLCAKFWGRDINNEGQQWNCLFSLRDGVEVNQVTCYSSTNSLRDDMVLEVDHILSGGEAQRSSGHKPTDAGKE
jgi:hypothetical protein